jgi:hypothetical protein
MEIESMEELYADDVSAPSTTFTPPCWEDFILPNIKARFYGVIEDVKIEPTKLASLTLTTRGGETLFITHGSEDGRLLVFPPAPVDWVICCHPKAVQGRYPYLPVLGDWDCPTSIHLSKGVLRVCADMERIAL